MKTTQNNSIESWLGRNAFAALATVLVVIGLVLLGTTFIPYLSETVKALLVAAFAVLLTAAGMVALRHRKNAFSISLLVAGLCALLISIFLAHETFGVINSTTATILIGLWGLACFATAWAFDVISLAIVVMCVQAIIGFPFLSTTTPIEWLDMVIGIVWVIAFATCTWLLIDKHAAAGTTRVNMRNAHIAILIGAEVALLHLAFFTSYTYSFAVIVALLAIALLVIANLPASKSDVRYYVPLRVNEIVVILFSAFIVSVSSRDDAVRLAIYSVALVCIAVLTIMRIRELPIAQHGSIARNPAFLVFGAIAPTFFLTGFLYGLTHLVDESYAYSVALMACALAAIAIGFRFQAAPLRLYGLILTIVCVLKLVTIDVIGLGSIARVIAFVVGGLICFTISALYTYANRQARAKEERL